MAYALQADREPKAISCEIDNDVKPGRQQDSPGFSADF